jgi:hypothetical protein
MKRTQKITFCSIISALAVVVMIISRMFPFGTYALPAIAGAFYSIIVIEAGIKWAIGSFLISALLSVFFAEPEAAAIFAAYLGYYPILKAFAEQRRSNVLSWIIKLGGFNLAMLAVYGVIAALIGSIEGFSEYGQYAWLLFLLVGNIVFVLYDIGLTRIITLYMYRYHERIRKIFK